MAKKKDTRSKSQIAADEAVLASLGEFQQNYLSDTSDEALKRIQEVREEVSKETKVIKKNTKTKAAIQKESKELEKTLKEHGKAIKKNKESGGFEVITDKKGETFIKAGKKKVKLDADALWNINNNQDKVKVEKPKKEKKQTKNSKPPESKPKKEKKEKVKRENPTEWDKKSFSVSKDRLIENLKMNPVDDASLMLKEYSVSELEQRIKSFSVIPALYRFANQQITILKNNLALKLKGKPPEKATRFVTDTLLEILGDAKIADDSAEKKSQLKRLTAFIKNVENKVLSEKTLPQNEKDFLIFISTIVYNSVKQDIKISSSLRGKLNKINLSGAFESGLDLVKTFNPFAGFLLEASVGAIAKTGKFAGKAFGNQASPLIDSDLGNIFDFKESERAANISKSNRGAFGKPKYDDFDDDFDSMPDTMEQLVQDQGKQTEVLNDILGTLDETKKTSDDLLKQNQEWKKEESIKLSKDRVSAENNSFNNPFPGVLGKQKDKKDGFLSKMFDGKDGFGDIGVADIFKGTLLTKIFTGTTKLIGRFAGGALKAIGKFVFASFIPNLFRVGVGLIGKFLIGSAAALLASPVLLTAAAIGVGTLAYVYRDEIWEVIKNLFTMVSEPVKKAIGWVADKIGEAKDIIFSKGLELFTNAKDFFKRTFNIFSNDDSSLENELIKLQKDLDNERKGVATTSAYLTKNKLPITTEVGGSNIVSRNQKVSQLESKIKETRKKILEQGADPSSPNIYGGVGRMTAMSESNNNAGLISSGKGDFGGKSYGIYQLASNTGTLKEFIDNSPYKDVLGKYPIGSPEFDNAWRQLAKDPNFANAQHEFIQDTHYGPMIDSLARNGIDIANRGSALKETIFSTANQYGPNSSLVRNALKDKDVGSMSDEDIITSIQDYKLANLDSTHKSSSSNVRQGVANRIVRERKEMLAKARNDKLMQGGKDKETQMASNNVINNNMINNKGGSGGASGGSSSTRTSDSTMNMLQMHMMRGTPMG